MTSPMIRMPRPGPGERLAPDDGLGQAELEADPPHLVLEQGAERLDERELEVVGQAADVVVALDVGGAGAAAGLHDVRVERALHEEVDRLAVGAGVGDDLAGGGLEHPDELAPDDLALLLRIADPGQGREEAVLGVDDLERHAGGLDEVPLDLLGLAGPQQPVVDEHAGEAVADRPLHERGRHRRVDAAGEPAQHALVTDRGPDRRHLLLDDVGHRPRGLGAGDLVEEVLEHGLAVLRVQHLRVELHAGHAPAEVLEGGDGGAGGAGRHLEPLGRGRDGVAVAHPHRLLVGQARRRAWSPAP